MTSSDSEFLEELNECNHTELVQLARWHAPQAHRLLPREKLIELILNPPNEDLPTRGINQDRHAIYEFVDRHWDQIRPLVSCPMKTRHPRACYQCPDIQVAKCILQNRKHFVKEKQ